MRLSQCKGESHTAWYWVNLMYNQEKNHYHSYSKVTCVCKNMIHIKKEIIIFPYHRRKYHSSLLEIISPFLTTQYLGNESILTNKQTNAVWFSTFICRLYIRFTLCTCYVTFSCLLGIIPPPQTVYTLKIQPITCCVTFSYSYLLIIPV